MEKRLITFIKDEKLVVLVMLLGILLRLVFGFMLPNWVYYKDVDAVVQEFNSDAWAPFRMPLFFMCIAAFPNDHIFSVALGIFSLPLFYFVVRGFFDKRIAFFSLIVFAFMPKVSWLAATGTDVSATIFFILLSMLMLAKYKKSNSELLLLVSGIFAAFGYLMSLPGAVFSIIIGAYLLLFSTGKLSPPNKGSVRRAVIFFAPSFLVFWWHLIAMGHLIEPTLSGVGAQSDGVILRNFNYLSGDYGLLEAAGRFVGYVYYDFWWHARGFDTEGQILSFLSSVGSAIPYFQIGLIVWAAATLLLSVLAIYGFLIFKRQKIGGESTFFLFNLIWIGYALFWVFLWWIGSAIASRHVYVFIIPFAVFSGFGLAKTKGRLSLVLVLLCLLLLVGTALVHSLYVHNRVSAYYGAASEWIGKNVGADATIFYVKLSYPWPTIDKYKNIVADEQTLGERLYEDADYIYVSSYKVEDESADNYDVVGTLLSGINDSNRYKLVFNYTSTLPFTKGEWVQIYQNSEPIGTG